MALTSQPSAPRRPGFASRVDDLIPILFGFQNNFIFLVDTYLVGGRIHPLAGACVSFRLSSPHLAAPAMRPQSIPGRDPIERLAYVDRFSWANVQPWGVAMTTKITRRSFVAKTGAAVSLAFLGQSIFNVEPASAASIFVRRNVGGMNAFDPVITAYRKAVAAMRLLPSTDPRSWTYQAAIHGTFTTPTQTAWNTCQHGNYFFWSWHRMYLYWFERICRRMACDDCFALLLGLQLHYRA